MKLNLFSIKSLLFKALKRYLIYAEIISLFGFFLAFSILFIQCESNDRYYRPDLPESLCSIGIIDVDDTTNYSFSLRDMLDIRNSTRYITFENSYQSEYPKDTGRVLDELEFKIYTDKEEIYYYQNNNIDKDNIKYELPDNLNFLSGETYYLRAKGKNNPEISAKTTVPQPPPDIKIISYVKEELYIQTPCRTQNTACSATFKISFDNKSEQKTYYMLMIIGTGMFSFPTPYSGPLDFSLRETNTPGFLANMFGLNSFQKNCDNDSINLQITSASAYFIDGSKIQGDKCFLTLSIQYNDFYSPVEELNNVQFKLLSIPKELYLFEKSLNRYQEIKNDPFSEPIYINGNIINGNGVFAICRSASVNFKIE
jgi:hypothetical protein